MSNEFIIIILACIFSFICQISFDLNEIKTQLENSLEKIIMLLEDK